MFETCRSTVLRDRNNVPAISGLLAPPAMRFAISPLAVAQDGQVTARSCARPTSPCADAQLAQELVDVGSLRRGPRLLGDRRGVPQDRPRSRRVALGRFHQREVRARPDRFDGHPQSVRVSTASRSEARSPRPAAARADRARRWSHACRSPRGGACSASSNQRTAPATSPMRASDSVAALTNSVPHRVHRASAESFWPAAIRACTSSALSTPLSREFQRAIA